MNVFEAIAKRHSYRGPIRDQKIPREHLKAIVQAGIQAPSGNNAQTTRFVIIDDEQKVKEIRTLHKGNKTMQQATAYIACIIDKNPESTYEGYSFQIEDCAAAVENMLLATTELEYATVWIDGWLRLNNHASKIGMLINLPADKIIRVLLPLGIPEKIWQQQERLPFEKRAWFNTFNQSN